ncbi:MAG: MT-A70 family methyltransferase [Aquirhabdus sp.]
MHTTTSTPLTIHSAAYLFPQMSEEDYCQLKDDIRLHGQQLPILVQNGQLIDGRHRYRACRELGLTPKIEEIAIDASAERLVVSCNLQRRHLNESQRAIIAARLSTMTVGSNQHTARAVSQQQAASDLNVSVDSLQRAKTVLNLGADQLIQSVEVGQLDVNNAAAIATLSEKEQLQVLAKNQKDILDQAKAIRKQKSADRRNKVLAEIAAKRAKNVPLDPRSGPYGVIYADPPWSYLSETTLDYPTMTQEEICALPVNQIAGEDAVLFLWCSASLIREALQVIDAWGFTYKTQAIWDKMTGGQGCYFRSQHEVLLLATRGNVPETPMHTRYPSVISSHRSEHSRKPEWAYEMIETMYPELNKLELFCRGEARSEWIGWGNECQPNALMLEQLANAPSAHISTIENRVEFDVNALAAAANDASLVEDVEFTESGVLQDAA